MRQGHAIKQPRYCVCNDTLRHSTHNTCPSSGDTFNICEFPTSHTIPHVAMRCLPTSVYVTCIGVSWRLISTAMPPIRCTMRFSDSLNLFIVMLRQLIQQRFFCYLLGLFSPRLHFVKFTYRIFVVRVKKIIVNHCLHLVDGVLVLY